MNRRTAAPDTLDRAQRAPRRGGIEGASPRSGTWNAELAEGLEDGSYEARRLVAVPELEAAVGLGGPTMSPKTVKRRLVLADLAAVMVGLGFAFVVQALFYPAPSATVFSQWLLGLVSLPFWLAAGAANSLYTARANVRPVDEFKHIVGTALFGVVAMVGLAFAVKFDDLARSWVLIVFASVVLALTIERRVARAMFRRLRTSGRLSRPILVVGTDGNAMELVNTVQFHPELGYRAVGFVGDDNLVAERCGLPWLGDLSRVEDVAAEVGAGGVMISLDSVDGPTVNMLSRRLTDAGLHVTLCSSLRDIDIHRLRVQELDGQALVYIEPVIRTGWRKTAMRVFDQIVAITGLVLTAPLVLGSAIAIRMESPGPVFFRQRRVGENGQPFDMIKLRTMYDGADEMKDELLDRNESDGPLFKIHDDPRITRVGRFLRKYSIDELPQFWNVVRGEMSVVGPRPALPSEVAQWDADVHERLRVLPGITGMWQVSGRSDTTFDEYKRLDLYYVDNWSLAHDLRILGRTIMVVLRGEGAS